MALQDNMHFGSKKPPEEIVSWQKKPIKKSLTALSKKDEKSATQTFKSRTHFNFRLNNYLIRYFEFHRRKGVFQKDL